MKLKLRSTVKYNLFYISVTVTYYIQSLKEENLKLRQCIIEKNGKIESLELNMRVLESQIIAAEVITADPVENMVQ